MGVGITGVGIAGVGIAVCTRSVDALLSYGHLKFSNTCKWALRSVVGRSLVRRRSSIFILLTLISLWERSARGVKMRRLLQNLYNF